MVETFCNLILAGQKYKSVDGTDNKSVAFPLWILTANPYGNFTKVTKEGKIALGLEYYFTTQREYNLLLNCESFCVEGFVAFKKKTNVYVCTEKTDCGWKMTEGNTYQINKRVNIENLYH